MSDKKPEIKQSKSPFPAMEEEVLNFWDKNKIFEKSVNNPPSPIDIGGKKRDYVFYDGPPFATGTPHYGHIVASAMKDVVPRYWTMRGYRVERKWGWDCHGLPIENIVEKEMGSKSKKDIENLGVEKFNELCRSKVLGYAQEWEKVIRRLGRWADMKNAYKTMDLNFMESVWWVFKELWGKGLIYEGYRSMHICPRCETTLSQSEVAEGYKMVKDLSAIAKFELVDEPGTFVLAWTTTPWTLIGNAALAVGKNIEYCKIKISNERLKIDGSFIVAKNIFNKWKEESAGDWAIWDKEGEEIADQGAFLKAIFCYNSEIIKEFKGKDLVGKKYKPLFNCYSTNEKLENRENGWKIYAADFVNTEEGTGIVHIAPAFGEDDMNLGKEKKLPFIQHVNMDGTIKAEAGEFAGMNVKPIGDTQKTDVEIIKYLAHNNLLFSKEKYEHSYPHCWRCETPLINYATSSWFVSVTKVKTKALKLAEKINWSPAHIKDGRFGNWLTGARDWSISRQRFWASVIPIWKCDEQENKKTKKQENQCGNIKVFGSVKELEDLSGEKITDLHKHIVDKITFKCEKCGGIMKRVPDVLDTWFDSGSMPYAQSHYPFENKEKFEKNFPAEFIAEGVDQTRAWFYYLHIIATAIKNNRAFNNVIVNGIVLAEDGKKMSKRLNNYPDPMMVFDKYGADAMRYYLISSPVMAAENFNFSETGVREALQKNIMILWNVYKFYEMYAGETKTNNPPNPLYQGGNNVLDQWILARLNQLVGEVTANMEKYDLPRATRPISDFINDLSTWYLRRSRDRFKSDDAKDKQAALATTKYVLIELAKVMAPFMPFIAETIWQKVSGLDFKEENKSVHLESWPTEQENKKARKQENNILENMETVRKIVELGLAKRDEAGIKVRQALEELRITNYELRAEYGELIKDELNVKNVTAKKGQGELSVELDTVITDDLKLEGLKREIVRIVNNLRKDAGLTIKDKIILNWQSESEMVKKVFTEMAEELKKDVLCGQILESEVLGKEVKVNGESVKLGIKKV